MIRLPEILYDIQFSPCAVPISIVGGGVDIGAGGGEVTPPTDLLVNSVGLWDAESFDIDGFRSEFEDLSSSGNELALQINQGNHFVGDGTNHIDVGSSLPDPVVNGSRFIKFKNSTAALQVLFGVTSTEIRDFGILIDGAGLLFARFGRAAAGLQTVGFNVGAVNDDKWHSAGITVDGVTARLYFDGVLVNQATLVQLGGITQDGNNKLCVVTDTNTLPFIGAIQDFAEWDKTLTDQDALDYHYSNPPQDSLVQYFPLDAAFFNEVRDMVGSSSFGTITGPILFQLPYQRFGGAPLREQYRIPHSNVVNFNGTTLLDISGVQSLVEGQVNLTKLVWVNFNALPFFVSGIVDAVELGPGSFSGMGIRTNVNDALIGAHVTYDEGGMVLNNVLLNGPRLQGMNTKIWHLLAVTWDGKTFSFYMDGFKCDESSTVGSNQPIAYRAAHDGRLAKGLFGGGDFINCYMKDYAIYNRTMSEGEIFRLWQEGSISSDSRTKHEPLDAETFPGGAVAIDEDFTKSTFVSNISVMGGSRSAVRFNEFIAGDAEALASLPTFSSASDFTWSMIFNVEFHHGDVAVAIRTPLMLDSGATHYLGVNDTSPGDGITPRLGYIEFRHNAIDELGSVNVADGMVHDIVFVNDGATQTFQLFIDGVVDPSLDGASSNDGGSPFTLRKVFGLNQFQYIQGSLSHMVLHTDKKDSTYISQYHDYAQLIGSGGGFF